VHAEDVQPLAEVPLCAFLGILGDLEQRDT
jgi:hypothetical protein